MLKRLTLLLLQALWVSVHFLMITRFISVLSVCTVTMNVTKLLTIATFLLHAVLVFQTVLPAIERNLLLMQKFYILILTLQKWIKILFQIIIFVATLLRCFLFLQERLSNLTTANGEKRLKHSVALSNSFKSAIMLILRLLLKRLMPQHRMTLLL